MPKGIYKRTRKHLLIMRSNGFQKGHKINLGEKSPNWKGEKASYSAHHRWIRNHKPAPKKCPKCGSSKNIQASNISGKYKRNINDWEYLCARCHVYKDGTVNNLKHGNTTNKKVTQVTKRNRSRHER